MDDHRNKMRLKASIVAVLFLGGGIFYFCRFVQTPQKDPALIVQKTWNGFKHFFIDGDGKVNRPKNGDVVSEGQAYAMLRAVWMDDKEAFDRVFLWTENNLSRKKLTGDYLLSWQWKRGEVVDTMPASDADVDYALSLIFAQSRWPDQELQGVKSYGDKAADILADLLDLMTIRLEDGRLYLLPWIVNEAGPRGSYPINPSYYSPAHFRIFYKFTNDSRWLELVETTYYLLLSLSENFEGQKGVGLVPDWCVVNDDGRFGVLEGKSRGFGWEAVRIPFRVALDALWFNEKRADIVLSRMAVFLENQWHEQQGVYSEYNYDGSTDNPYENPAFYSAYYFAVMNNRSEYTGDILNKNRSYLKRTGDHWIYLGTEEYFVNSLAWLADGINADIFKNFYY